MKSPDRTEQVLVDDGVKLAVYYWRARAEPPSDIPDRIAVVLVHQYSKLGGCSALMRGLAASIACHGLPVVTFDLRGVGSSTGRSTFTGSHEVKDVEAVCKWVHQSLDLRVLLVGSSAGAPIAGSAVSRSPSVLAFVAIGYVFGWWASWLFGRHYDTLLEASVPKLFIMGDSDGFTTVKQLQRNVRHARGDTDSHIFPGVGHFELEGEHYDERVVEVMLAWLRRQSWPPA